MSAELQTRKANVQKPLRALIYGIEGVGKSTFGAKANKPIFINIEDRVDHLTDANGEPVQDLGIPKTLDDVEKQLNDLYTQKHDFKTVVIDSIDWLERLVHAKILGTTGKSMAVVEGGFGAGYSKSEAIHVRLRDQLTKLRNERGMEVILTAHYAVKTVKDPEATADYQAFEIKCHEKVASMWREWADVVLFARFETFIKEEEGEKTQARGTGKRIVQTEKRPGQQAKNCYGLPAELPFDENFYSNLKAFIAKKKPAEILALSVVELQSSIQAMFDNVDEKMKETIKKAIDDAGLDKAKLSAIHKRMKELNLDKKKAEAA